MRLTLLLGRGGGENKSLSVSADGSTQLTLNLATGLYHGVILSAKFRMAPQLMALSAMALLSPVVLRVLN